MFLVQNAAANFIHSEIFVYNNKYPEDKIKMR